MWNVWYGYNHAVSIDLDAWHWILHNRPSASLTFTSLLQLLDVREGQKTGSFPFSSAIRQWAFLRVRVVVISKLCCVYAGIVCILGPVIYNNHTLYRSVCCFSALINFLSIAILFVRCVCFGFSNFVCIKVLKILG